MNVTSSKNMKVFFVAILCMIPLYCWYRVVMKIDKVFLYGRTADVVLSIMIGLGWLGIGYIIVKLLEL